MSVMGRPTKLTVELTNKICDMLRAGNYLETAAAYAGIDKATLHRWMKRGARELERVQAIEGGAEIAEEEQMFVDFCNSIKKALAEGEVRDMVIISNAAKQDWKAAAWKLERKFPEKWGRKERLDANLTHTGKDGGPIQHEQQINLDKLTNEELMALERIVQKSSETD